MCLGRVRSAGRAAGFGSQISGLRATSDGPQRRLTLHTRFGHEHWPAMLVRRRRWLDRASGHAEDRPEVNMGSVGPTHLISLLLAVAIIAAICGFIASAVVRRNKRRARGFFLLGFLCGFIASPILRRRRRGLNVLGAVARCADVRPLTASFRTPVRLRPHWWARPEDTRPAARSGWRNRQMAARRTRRKRYSSGFS